MWLMLQVDEPEDFVIATGEVHSVREFVEKAFEHIGKTIDFLPSVFSLGLMHQHTNLSWKTEKKAASFPILLP
uniref:Uncharacterized protein n=1 Tax=Sphaerodactylus townsendi TaxID=933632 RepID=A0ACB8FBY4_9SAUR